MESESTVIANELMLINRLGNVMESSIIIVVVLSLVFVMLNVRLINTK